MLIQMKQALVLISKFANQMLFKCILGCLKGRWIGVAFDPMRALEWGVQESFYTLEHEISNLMVRYIRVITNQEW